jgi:3-deoxy-7-phosphoheptulonate synthase
MIITLKQKTTKKQVNEILKKIVDLGFSYHISKGESRTIIGVIGKNAILTKENFENMPQVESVTPISKPFKLVSREFKKENTIVKFGNNKIGDKKIVVIAGPCSVESKEKILQIAKILKRMEVDGLRGGAYKPRTSPYSFQGLGEEGLKYLYEAKKITGLPIVSEVMTPELVPVVSKYVDMLQIGARNMQNYYLLKEVGKINKPVLLKRGLSATVEELFMAAEYIMSQGNSNIVLCERGIRTFETYTRFTLDLNAIPIIKNMSHLPVIVDPSHGVGVRDYIPALCRASIAAGADGLIIEVHQQPELALSDGSQSLFPEQFMQVMKELKYVAKAVGRYI